MRLPTHRALRRPTRSSATGQALLEFALVLPVFLVLLLAVFDVGRVIWATTSLNGAAREAARFAIAHGGSPSDTCPVGPAGPDAIVPAASGSCPYPSPSKQSVYDAATAAAAAGGSGQTVTVCYGTGCSGDTDTGDNRRGTPVTVVITTNIQLAAPALLGFTSFTISGNSTMVVNH